MLLVQHPNHHSLYHPDRLVISLLPVGRGGHTPAPTYTARAGVGVGTAPLIRRDGC